MSGARWQWRDSGSACGHMQQVAGSGAYHRIQTAYRAYIDHATTCDGCRHGEVRCARADDLWDAYRAARS
ncbi:hypothetical protein ACFVXA_24025 [Streptomyces sp. NPDC058246]|uniref:hypothetical protein n=1 Tax=Streptomyces sp. NPDC058246 TaxID=3346400 RepID=UPI0036E1583A